MCFPSRSSAFSSEWWGCDEDMVRVVVREGVGGGVEWGGVGWEMGEKRVDSLEEVEKRVWWEIGGEIFGSTTMLWACCGFGCVGVWMCGWLVGWLDIWMVGLVGWMDGWMCG